MSEEVVKEPTKEAYTREYAYHAAQLRQSHDFNTLLDTVPEEQSQVRETMRGLLYTKPDKLLDPEKLQQLKGENPSLYGEVSQYYLDFLKKAAGLD